MNIFEASHALMVIEDSAGEQGLHEEEMVSFFMWLSDQKFKGHIFSDDFVATVLKQIENLVKEYGAWVKSAVEQAVAKG